ncbi:MAG: sensor domain-containing diguanylate cyclase, partial [Chloroflexi bacterium]|nr:sensor domain-containing diguanylate cyclase [Chloroflexota bacterium]
MKNQVKQKGFTPQEHQVSSLPAIAVGIVLLTSAAIAAATNFPAAPAQTNWLLVFSVLGAAQFSFHYFIHSRLGGQLRLIWLNALIATLLLCALSSLLPDEIDHLIYMLVFIAALPMALLSNRGPSHVLLFGVTTYHLAFNLGKQPHHELLTHFSFTAAAFIGIETVQQLRNVAVQRIKRLEVINELSKQIVSTLNTKQIFALLNAVFQNALEADAYYVGVAHEERLYLELLYDDGEYFPDLWVNRKGTLANWVMTHQKSLFLPDLRKRAALEGVEVITVGKNKPTHSWMGAPMRGARVNGIIAISSYRPNAFDLNDMELLENIAQRAALALDNAYRHEEVEKQARLDSLTGVYNHGYFINLLREQTQECREKNQPLSLIMLDVDHFKQYNDTFGHLIGDEVLVSLCSVIQRHVKATDAVGRWGGEEFCVSLPNASVEQAL